MRDHVYNNANNIHTISNVLYRVVDGMPLYVDICYPESVSPLPAVLYIQGNGWWHDNRKTNTTCPLAAKGFLTACVDHRLSTQAPFPAQLEDVKATVRWLRQHAEE